MSQITLDPALVETLLASMQTVEICDTSGNVIGLFSPKIDPNEYEVVGPEISDEELVRRMNSHGQRIPAAEVLGRLREP